MHAIKTKEYRFEGRTVALPVVVRDASSANATYVVPSAAARRLLPTGLVPAEIAPGRTLFSLAAIDYRDNDLGDYNEVSLAFFVAEDGAGKAGRIANVAAFFQGTLPTYIHRLPVDQSFTCAAGRGIWGFPKTIEQIEIDAGGDRCRCTLRCDGRMVLTLSVARGGRMKLPDRTMRTYTRIDGATHVTDFISGAYDVGVHLGGAELTLGNHPIADELRTLGLPKRALMSAWLGHMHGRFEAPVPV